jgi:hypothetical protein
MDGRPVADRGGGERNAAGRLLDPGAPAQRAGVLSSLNMVADSLELLPEWEHTRPTFATAEWYTERKRWVFLTSTPPTARRFCRSIPCGSIYSSCGCKAPAKTQPRSRYGLCWTSWRALNKLPQLHAAVTENRKYGNPVVLGFQGRSQLEKRYGQDAEAMLSQPATKCFSRPPSRARRSGSPTPSARSRSSG